MTLSQDYRHVQRARKKPCLDYPYLSLPDIEDSSLDYKDKEK